jgi:ribonuclease inhibitor
VGEGEVKGTHALLDGRTIKTREQFHAAIKSKLALPEHYGMNLDALWDSLTGDVPPPVSIEWIHSEVSKEHLGEYFGQIQKLLADLKKQDPTFQFEMK